MDDLGPVLIANRGEIAVRVARTVHSLGLGAVGVVTEADTGALHAEVVDMAVPIASYLEPDELLRAAALSGARSVHPGYGFLSENASFARAVVATGLVWIGPPPEAIELMGDKAQAKQAAREAGVPVVPDAEDGRYPVVVKALAGGGGRGMRVVRSADELEPATEAAKREALAAFGDGRVMVERYLERPRHLEIQVLADRRGAVVHLGERECTLQRRHQKVVEEAPSPVVGAELRARMGEAAVALTRACGYAGAGTVEFVATGDGSDFYFLEMNTRLQVEHPVTELVYGIDLVEQQLRVAAGEPLALRQEGLVPRGHAVEARLYAEDPAHGFLPSIGTVLAYGEPDGEGVRVDSGIRAGSEVGTSYDPLLAKVIGHGPDRATAMRRLDRGLARFDLLGVATNAAFTRTLLAREDVRAGQLDTGLLERSLAELVPEPPEDLVPAALLAAAGGANPPGPWRRRLQGLGEVRVAGGWVTVGERSWRGGEVRPGGDGALRVGVEGIERRYLVDAGEETIWVARDGHTLALRTEPVARGSEGRLTDSLQAPMPGTVLAVNVAEGDAVREGELLMVLESMKMELSVTAPHDGVVDGLELDVGDRVLLGQALLSVHAPDGEPA